MPSRYFALIELLLFAALALGIGFWQLWSVSRELKKTRAEAGQEEDSSPSD